MSYIIDNRFILHNSPEKKSFPVLDSCMNNIDWLIKIKAIIGTDVVFALDSALFIDGLFLGWGKQRFICIYGPMELSEKFNDVFVVGDISELKESEIVEKKGLRYTSISRTVEDFLIWSDSWDDQSILEGLNCYYYEHKETFDGIIIKNELQAQFDALAADALDYYMS